MALDKVEQAAALEALLNEAEIDFLNESYVAAVARSVVSRPVVDARPITQELLRVMIESGGFVAGELEAEGFVPWDGTRADWLSKIDAKWNDWGASDPTPGSIVWLDVPSDLADREV